MPWGLKNDFRWLIALTWCFSRGQFRRILNNHHQRLCSLYHHGGKGQRLFSVSVVGIIGSAWFLFCLQHVVHVVTVSSIFLLRPGHHTESRALSRHLRIPWCPAWILSRMSNRRDEGITILRSFRRRSLWEVIVALLDQYGFNGVFCFVLSGQPSIQNSNSFLHTSSFCWWSLNSSSILYVPWKLSRMCETYKFKSSLRRSSSFESCLSRGSLDRVSAVTNSFPGTCSILNEYFISLIRNLWIPVIRFPVTTPVTESFA